MLLEWFKKGELVVFKKTIWRKICYGLGSFYCSIYQCVIKKSFPIYESSRHQWCHFQQENAAIHTSKLTKDWFKTKNIEILDWPTKSPDLNPFENFLGILSRWACKNKCHFEDRETLKSCIKQYWNSIWNSLKTYWFNPKQVYWSI